MTTVQPVLPANEINKVNNTTPTEPNKDVFIASTFEKADDVDRMRDKDNDEYDVIE